MSKHEEEYYKNCPYCNTHFEAKRTNQKFCDKVCKYRFNNRKRKEKELIKHPHQKRLDKNHRVLELTYKSTKKHEKLYSKKELQSKGFSFEYLTRSAETSSGKDAIGIYNFFLCEEEEGFYSINKVA